MHSLQSISSTVSVVLCLFTSRALTIHSLFVVNSILATIFFTMKSSIFLIASLLSLCSADASADSFGDEAEGIPNSDWGLAMRSANATGIASIPGYNIRKKYPGEKSDNWTVSISVASDIPGGNSASGKFVTGTQIEWKGPPGVISGADSSWFLCRNVYSSLKLKQSGAGSTNGSCSGLLSDRCLSALQESLQAGTQCQNNTLPSVCVDELELTNGQGFGLTSGRFCSFQPIIYLPILTMLQLTQPRAPILATQFRFAMVTRAMTAETSQLTTLLFDKSGSS